jgi:hypothetical protein
MKLVRMSQKSGIRLTGRTLVSVSLFAGQFCEAVRERTANFADHFADPGKKRNDNQPLGETLECQKQ